MSTLVSRVACMKHILAKGQSADTATPYLVIRFCFQKFYSANNKYYYDTYDFRKGWGKDYEYAVGQVDPLW